MRSKPSRLFTALLMLPTWGFAHAVLIFRVLTEKDWFGSKFDSTHQLVLFGLAIVLGALASLVAARRATVLGWSLPPLLGLLIHVPFVGAGLALWLAATGDEYEQGSLSPTDVAGRLVVPFILGAFACMGLAVGAELLDKEFGLKGAGGYFGMAIFVGLPFAIGLSGGVILRRAGGTFGQAIAAAMTLLGAVILILFSMAMEGIVCIIMAAPFGAVLAFLGTAIGYLASNRKVGDGTLQSAAWLAIVVIVGLEGWNPPAPLEGTTSSEIIINAPPARVWAELHDIRDLPPTDNILFRHGIAHPLGTITNGQGVGAARLCKLSTGEMPELITVWKPREELRFKVLSTPPSMRETGFFGRNIDTAHIHSAYASLDGGFKLTPLPDGRTQVVGESHYLLNIAPASYWNLWTVEIVRMIQRRVLEHIKTRAESDSRA